MFCESRYFQSEKEYFSKILVRLRGLANLEERQKLIGLEGIMKSHDLMTHRHSSQVANISHQLAVASGLSQGDCLRIFYGGLFHDIGKIFVPQAYLHRRNDSDLSINEKNLLISHGIKGAYIFRYLIKSDEDYACVCEQHWIGAIEDKPPSQADIKGRHKYVPFVTIADLIASSFDTTRIYQPKYRGRDVIRFINKRFDEEIFPEYIKPAFKKLMTDNRYLRYL